MKTLTHWMPGTSLVVCLLFATAFAADSGGENSAEHLDKPYVILLSIDGFRWDYQRRYDTPALDRISAAGVTADALIPVYPTLTFPNHYSIATGLYPARHGIVDNTFYDKSRENRYTLRDRAAVQDGSWYGGNPLWVVAEQNGMVSAAYFFIGTEADVQGVRPSHWYAFDGNVPGEARVAQVLDWLKLPPEKRPHLITTYFEDVDEAAHTYGVGSPPMIEAITLVDGLVGQLLDGIDELPIADETYVVVVSDHGQSNFRRNETPFIVDEVVDLNGIRVVDHGTSVSLYFAEPDRVKARAICNAINRSWERGQALTPGDAPDAWHLTADSAFADVIVQADPKAMVRSTRMPPPQPGAHGWTPDFKDMHGFFIAAGPRLPAGQRIDDFESVDVYPFLLEILDLPLTEPIDGDPATLIPLLAPE